MQRNRTPVMLLIIAAFALVLSACGSPTPTNTPTAPPTETAVPPTETAVPPTETPVPPTDTPAPTDTPEPTATPTEAATVAVAIEPTATSRPTDTPRPTSTPRPTDTPEPTATPTREPTATRTVAPTATLTLTPVAVVQVGECRVTGELVVGTDAAYPPFENVNTVTNEIEGFDIDLLNAIGERMGFTAKYENTPFDPIFINLAAGQFDLVISASTITEERSKTVSFSNPYFAAGQVIVVRQADAERIKTPEDLAGKTVGVQLGTTGAEAAKSIADVRTLEYQTAPEAFQALANGDVEAVVNDNVVSLTLILNRPELNLVVSSEVFTVEYYGIAVRQECPDLLAKINEGLAAVIADGTYAEIYKKYLGEEPPQEFQEGGQGIVLTPEPEATPAEGSGSS